MRTEHSRKGIILLLCANTLFWLWLWIDFSASSIPFHGHIPSFDDAVPTYVWGGRAVPYPSDVDSVPYRLMKRIQQPAYAIAVYSSWKIVKLTGFEFQWGDETFHGVSVGSYQIAATLVLSFFQWFLIAKIARWLFLRGRGRRPSPNIPAS